MDTQSDVDRIVESAQSGDDDAWAVLLDGLQDVAVALALGTVGDWHAAHDAAQDAFTLALLHIGKLSDPQAFPAWFARLVRTACSRQTRVRRPEPRPVEELNVAAADELDPAD